MLLTRLLLFAFLASGLAEKCPTNKSNSKLFCYYGKLEEINNCKCTHVILPPNSDVKSIEKLRLTLQGVKILITVHEFNEGLVQLLKDTKVDGLEVNLNKINSKEDIGDFITTAKSKLGNDLVTVVSVPPRADLLAKYYDFKGLTKHTDAFILQTAFLGASKNITFHPSRLSGIWDMQNADTVVDLVTGLGAPLSKLVIAAPVQAFQFKLQNEEHTAVGSPALEVRSITRDELCDKMKNSDWTLERDQDQAGPYIFRKDEWIAFDDQTSMDIKAKYARVRGLAGLALKDLSQDGGKKCGGSLLDAAYTGLSRQARAPRGAVLHSLEREILESPAKPFANIQLSPFRITRIVDVEGKVHTVRQDTRTEFECSRQGYFVHPRSCNRFYRCVKFNQLSEEYNVFEFDCPAGLAFDSKVEVCVWPGSLSDGSACSGSSEIAPVPKERYVCPQEPGYYADPENCRWFFACLDHGESGVMTPYEFRCPFGLVFDQGRLLCEWPWLVPQCGSGHASGAHQSTVQFFGGNGQASTGQYYTLDNFNGIGTLQPVALNGVSGKIDQSINKVYSSFANHGANQGYYGNQGNGQGSAQSHGSFGHGLQFGGREQVLSGSQGFGTSSHASGGSSQGFGDSSQGSGASSHGVGASSQVSGASSQGFGASAQGFGQNHGSGEATSSQYQTHQGNHGTTHQGSGILVETQGFGGSSQEVGQNHASGGATSSQYQSNQGSHGATLQGSGLLVGTQGQQGVLVGTQGVLLEQGSAEGAAGYQHGSHISGLDASNRGSTKYQYHGSGSNGEYASQGNQFDRGSTKYSFGQNSNNGLQAQEGHGVLIGGQDVNINHGVNAQGNTGEAYQFGSHGSQANYNSNHGSKSQEGDGSNGVLIGGEDIDIRHGINSQGNSGEAYQFGGQQAKYNSNHGSQSHQGYGSNGVVIGVQDVNLNHGVNTQANSGEAYQFGSQQANYNANRGSQSHEGYGSNGVVIGSHGSQANLAVNAHEINNGFSNEGSTLVNHGSQAYGQQGIKYTNTDGGHHQVSFGFASGGFGQGIQNVDHSGQQVYVNNQNGGSAYSSQSNNLLTDQNVNIVGGGFSAVKGYGHHEVVTPSTIAVSTGIPTVTSVPLLSTVDLHHTGVVANVPELQVKINSPSEVNIHHGVNQFVSTTTSAPEVSTGYYYEKPKVPFIDGQSYSKVEHQQTGYHYEKPSIVFEEKPQKTQLKEVVHSVFGVQSTGGYDYPKPSIPFEETKIQKPSRGYSYQHFNKAHAAAKQEFIQVPVVSTQQTIVEPANSYSYQSSGHSDNQQYVKVEQPTHQIVQEPTLQIVQQPVIKVDKTQPGHSYSYQSFGKVQHGKAEQHVVVPQPILEQHVVQQPIQQGGHSYSYQNLGHGEKKEYVNVEQPVHHVEVQNVVQEVVQPHVEVQKTVVQPAQSFSYQSFGKGQSNQYANAEHHGQQHIAQEVVQPQIELQKTVLQPAQSYSYSSFGHGQSNQFVKTEQQPIVNVVQPQVEIQKTVVQPAQSFSYQTFGKGHSNQYAATEQPHVVQEVIQPHVEIQKTVVQPAQSFSYQSFGKHQSNQIGNTDHIVQEVVQPQVERQKTFIQPAQSFSYQSFGKGHSNQYANTDQQHVVQEVIQPHVEIQKTVVQPAQSFSYQSFGKAHSNEYANNEQQHVVQEVIQPQIELQKIVAQPAQSVSYQTFGKDHSNQYANTEQQHVVQEVVQPQIELQKTVVQPAQSFSYQTFGKQQNNQYANTEQQHVVQEVVQPQIELKKTVVQPAQSFSYQTFGKQQNNQYANTEQQHVVQEVVQPQIELKKTVVQPAHTYSYQSQNTKVVKPIIKPNVEFQSHVFQPVQQHVEVQKQPAQTYSYVSFGKAHETKIEQPLVQQEVVEQPIQHHVKIEQPILHQTIVEQPVVTEKTIVQAPANSYSYFGTHKQNHKYVNVEQPVHTYVQQPAVQTYAQGEEKSYNQGSSYSYQSFGAKEQQLQPEQVQPEVIPQVFVSSTVKPVEYHQEQVDYHQEQEGYHYPQPLEPVKEEPFVAKKAYVTGQSYYHQKSNLLGTYSLNENEGSYVSSTPAYEETYVSSTPKYQEPTQQIFYQSTPEVLIDQTKKPIYVQPKKLFVKTAKQTVYVPSTEANYFLSSTPAATYQSTLNTLVDKEPLKFYLYDSRLPSKSSTAAPEIVSSTYKPLKTLKSSRPIARYEFSSLDSGYGYSSTPVIEVTSQRRKPTRPSNAYLPVKVTTAPYIEVTTPIVRVKPARTYLPSVGTAGQILENYQAGDYKAGEYQAGEYQAGEYQSGEYEEVVSRRPVKVVKVIRPAKSKAIVKINDFHPMLSAKLGGQCTCVSNTVSLKKNPIQVENYSIDDGDDGYIVENNPEYDSQKVVEITPASEVSSTPSVVIRKRVKARPITVSYEETPVTKAAEYFIKSTRQPIDGDDEPSDVEVKQAVKTVKKLVKAAAKQGAKEGTKEALKDFDRYGPGGVRSRLETLQGIDCQRAGLFRHPSQCNKFYSCRWDCDKNKFTLHVFNCPVHLTFDSNLGACNWPSQGPACSGNTLLPSD